MQSYRYKTPGVYTEEIVPPLSGVFRTGVPVFLGFTQSGSIEQPVSLSLWSHFQENFGSPRPEGYLADAVHGFFQNGGRRCYVVRLNEEKKAVSALQEGLDILVDLDTVDLICAPDIMLGQDQAVKQKMALAHCDQQNDRFAILDSMSGITTEATLAQRQGLVGQNGALYFPWIRVFSLGADAQIDVSKSRWVPPCGHIAGVYARSDFQVGPYKAPANEILEGVMDLKINLMTTTLDRLNEMGVNCLRAFAGRGIRVWGARTLSNEPTPGYVNVRRLMITVSRWIERFMTHLMFEQNNFLLWMRIERELSVYLDGLFQEGALKGSSQKQAFYVKCNEETNPPEVRDAGEVVTEIGLAPAAPCEFIVVRIIHGSGGVLIT